MAMIEIKQISKRYRHVQALKEVSFSVPTQCVFGLLGQNGAGKTTLIRILAGLINQSSGTFTIDGMTMPACKESVGYLSQTPSFYPWMTGRELLTFSGQLYGMDPRVIKKRIPQLLDLCKIEHASHRRIGEYSSGMIQRLGIAQAILHKPKVVLLDEPASALDPLGRKDILQLIRTLREETTVFMSSHILEDMQRVCDEVAIIREGSLILQDTMKNLLKSQAQPIIRLEFETMAAAATFHASMNSFGVTCHMESSSVVSMANADYLNTYEQILQVLSQHTLLVKSISTQNATLEDVFVYYMKEHTYA